MDEPYVGQICLFPFNFAPRGWALCEGQLLPISQNTALFSLLGTTYGGNGRSNFALPDMRSNRMSDYFGGARAHKGYEALPLRYFIALQGIFPARP